MISLRQFVLLSNDRSIYNLAKKAWDVSFFGKEWKEICESNDTFLQYMLTKGNVIFGAFEALKRQLL